MTRVAIDCRRITGWRSFHKVFATTLGFPDFYGANMDAWIDCMSYIDDAGAGMSKITCAKGDFMLLELAGAKDFRQRCPEQYAALMECTAFVNQRCLEAGKTPVLMVAFAD